MTLQHLHYINNTKQSGVTLLLSMLVLSSIASVAFSLAAVTFIEVRTSGDVQRTEPVYYSDQGIAEEAIFALKRDVSTVNFGSNCDTNFISYPAPDPSITSETKICNISAQSSVEVIIPASASSYAASRRFYLFDPSNGGTGPGGYSRITITNTSKYNVPIRVYICRLDRECTSPGAGTEPWVAAGDDIAQGASRTYQTPVIDGDSYSYEVSIINLTTVNLPQVPQDLFAKIDTFAADGVTPKGLPYLNKQAVQIQSTKASLTRRVEVLIPTQ